MGLAPCRTPVLIVQTCSIASAELVKCWNIPRGLVARATSESSVGYVELMDILCGAGFK